jgi:hypothetical protein
LKLWNTMPTSRRTRSTVRGSSVSSMPSTTTRPLWCSSSRLTRRISVDLPEPDGPHTTTFSPRPTARSTSFSAWNAPNHLLTLLISIMGASSALEAFAVA